MENKYLFLDIDGVLNNHFFYILGKQFEELEEIDGRNMMVLKEIIKKFPEMKIVLSSTWRNHPVLLKELEKYFNKYEIPMWIDKTPFAKGMRYRSDEIVKYIRQHNINKEQIVVLDDISVIYFDEIDDRVVNTDPHDGLTYKEYVKVCNMFGKKADNFTF